MTGGHDEYETYKHEHELLPKWGRLVSRVLDRKPTDSTLKTAARFGGMITAPIWLPVPTIAAHAYDEIMYTPVSPFAGVPGYMQYKASKALFPPKPGFLPSPDRFKLPIRPPNFVTIPKAPSSTSSKMVIRPQPVVRRPASPPPRPFNTGLSNSSMVNRLRIAEPSWKLKLNSTFKPAPSINTRMTLTPRPLGTSLPYRPFVSNLGLGVPKLSMGRF